MQRRQIPFEARKPLDIEYKGITLKRRYVADFLCLNQIIIEIRAAQALTPRDECQLINYLQGTHMHVGLLFNSCSPGRLHWRRYVI